MSISLNLPQETQNLLLFAQKETKKSKENIITEALVSYLEDLEDYKSAMEAEKRMSKNEEFINAQDLFKQAGI